jgi:RNA polymerase sigma factor (sigma-70 family)
MAEGEEGVDRLIHGLRDGNQQLLREFCAEYGDRLHRLAEKRMGGKLRRRVGPEDVVQSAYRTFLRRAQGSEFELPGDSEGLWRLLCAITLKKIYQKARAHRRLKRDYDKEVQVGSEAAEEAGLDNAFVDPQPLPDEEAAFADQFEQLVTGLNSEEQQVVDLKLQGFTNEEVAERLSSSERTVRRMMKKIQRHLERTFEEPGAIPGAGCEGRPP